MNALQNKAENCQGVKYRVSFIGYIRISGSDVRFEAFLWGNADGLHGNVGCHMRRGSCDEHTDAKRLLCKRVLISNCIEEFWGGNSFTHSHDHTLTQDVIHSVTHSLMTSFTKDVIQSFTQEAIRSGSHSLRKSFSQ